MDEDIPEGHNPKYEESTRLRRWYIVHSILNALAVGAIFAMTIVILVCVVEIASSNVTDEVEDALDALDTAGDDLALAKQALIEIQGALIQMQGALTMIIQTQAAHSSVLTVIEDCACP